MAATDAQRVHEGVAVVHQALASVIVDGFDNLLACIHAQLGRTNVVVALDGYEPAAGAGGPAGESSTFPRPSRRAAATARHAASAQKLQEGLSYLREERFKEGVAQYYAWHPALSHSTRPCG